MEAINIEALRKRARQMRDEADARAREALGNGGDSGTKGGAVSRGDGQVPENGNDDQQRAGTYQPGVPRDLEDI